MVRLRRPRVRRAARGVAKESRATGAPERVDGYTASSRDGAQEKDADFSYFSPAK